MFSHSKLERFKVSNEQLARLGSEFNSEALPLLEILYNTTFWILLKKKFAKKIIKQTFYEAIEYCNVTKNEADWKSWILRIWIREILDFYSGKENDTRTNFAFIENKIINPEEVFSLVNLSKLKSSSSANELLLLLKKLPAVLRIPLIMKEIGSFNYEKIAELIDVPIGVIATRIYRAKRLLFIYFSNNFHYEEAKKKWSQKDPDNKIFELRKCLLFVDDEMTSDEKTLFANAVKNDSALETEILIQNEIKVILKNCSQYNDSTRQLKGKIERKAKKKFNTN